MIKKGDFVLHGKETGSVIGVYDKGYFEGKVMSPENRVLCIVMASGSQRLLWEAEAKKLKKFGKNK